jgi:hypothetical protein
VTSRILSILAITTGSMLSLSAQQRLATGTPNWTGSVRCEIDFKGAGYVNHETHTWTLTGAPPADGSQDYPGTWTVSGSGSRTPTDTVRSAATWKTEGSAPGVRMAIFVRQSDQRLLVLVRHGQLSAANGTTGMEELAELGRRAQPRPISRIVTEWRPFPTIQDAASSTHVMNSSTTPLTRLDASQPIGTSGQALCTWDLVQGPGVSLSGAAPASGAPASAAAGARAGAIATAAPAPAPRAGAGTVGRAAPAAAAGNAAGAAANTAVVGGVSVGGATGATGAISESAAPTSAPRAAGAAPASATTTTTPPSGPVAAGCDADLVTIACVLPPLRNGSGISADANFHVASDTHDWFTVIATMNASEAAFALIDVSLSGGTADGSYAIEVSEAAPPAPKLIASSGAAHAPKTSVAWATSSATSKTLFIQVRHIAGAPANALYSLRLSMSGSQTAPITVSALSPGALSPIVPSTSSGATGTLAPARRTLETNALPATSGGKASTTISQDGMPNSCASAGNKVVSVSPGAFIIVTGGIEAAGVEDWLTVHFTSASVHVTLGSPVPIPGGSEFQIATYSTCSAPSVSPTTGSGTKSLDLPGSGPQDVIVRITASPWNATNATYTLRLEGK